MQLTCRTKNLLDEIDVRLLEHIVASQTETVSMAAPRPDLTDRRRLGRSLKNLIGSAEALRAQGVGLRSLKEAIDTDSSTGQLVFHIFGALAEFERALIRERTRAGPAAARARGRVGGRRSAR